MSFEPSQYSEASTSGTGARVALVGDSHSQALWPRVAKALTDAGDVVALQVSNPGWSEAKYLAAGDLAAKLQAARPDVVVYELGGNNAKTTAEAYGADARALVDLARKAGARSIVWFGPATAVKSPWRESHDRTAALQASILPGLGVSWHDSRSVTTTGQRDDGVHFANYAPWATWMLPRIANATPAGRSWGLGTGLALLVLTAGGAYAAHRKGWF